VRSCLRHDRTVHGRSDALRARCVVSVSGGPTSSLQAISPVVAGAGGLPSAYLGRYQLLAKLAAGGMAGVNLADGARVLFFGSAEADAVVATVSIPEAVLAGTDPGRGKVTALAEFPGKGRATAGVRAQSFLKGESALAHAWVGPGPALAVSSDGSARNLPDPVTKRDASGTVLDGVIAAIGRRL